ncbi:uncharacterized protein LOC100831757 [Brachypodium distachyon]|uniref:DUF538 family protein n=1 Tax=Brachypodium distachyon TaxID=15368 RepID=I1I5F2_BRADI|nr:uncharacterized protein LOC100831757 [Brachypodium distachyon]KQJ97469.1 hypothetical protein BRADI_3g30870v3 [Brachypodium distachyon]|eukprot:XP_003574198.1 uncharacterized protein LOC100831757 [Brachypodium distachyon]
MGSLTVSSTAAATGTANTTNKDREGAEIIRGAEACYAHSKELLKSMGFPGGVMPMRGLEECGLVRATGYVWMRQASGKQYEHTFPATGTKVRYDAEVTAYVEQGKMKRMTGVRSKQMLMWVPIVEMSLDGERNDKVYFKSAVGIGRSFPAAAFPDEDEVDVAAGDVPVAGDEK